MSTLEARAVSAAIDSEALLAPVSFTVSSGTALAVRPCCEPYVPESRQIELCRGADLRLHPVSIQLPEAKRQLEQRPGNVTKAER